MTQINRRFPTFSVELVTQNSSYNIVYNTAKQLTQGQLEEGLLSFSVKNSMADDSPVFSLVIVAKEKWDTILNANDLVKIRVYPDITKPVPDNPYIMVGLLSDIHKEGDYANGSMLYRLTGQAMSKALMSFDVGVIQEVATIIPTIGWLPDGTENGLHFTGNNAAGIGNELMERFIYKYAQYAFADGKGLKDYFIHNFTSWSQDETLTDPTPFINYQGSLRQFLEDIVAKPFNELFFEYTSLGQCVALMRPAPFDPGMWYQLPTYRFTSDTVVQESFGKNDNEVYSVYVVNVPSIIDVTGVDLGVFPKFNPELVKKYGYRRLEVDNRYLLSSGAAAAVDSTATVTDSTGEAPPSYEDLLTFITQNKLNDAETLRTKKDTVYSAIKTQYPALTKSVVNGIIDAIKAGTFSKDSYGTLLASAGDDTQAKQVNKEKTVASEKLNAFTQRLYNWYCENGNYYSGDIRVLGHPAYRLGSRILYDDFEQDTTWEFYLESVQHEFSFTTGYLTILGVTRGLAENGVKRFTNLWGQSDDFKGGYLGEKSLEDLVAEGAQAAANTTGNSTTGTYPTSSGGGNAVSLKALATGQALTHQSSVYVFGAGRSGQNPFNSSPIRADCSSFVWWCFNVNGVSLNGGATGMTTDTIAADPRVVTISARGASKDKAMQLVQPGDLVWFDTYKNDGHIGIYSGNGNFVACNSNIGITERSMTSGYNWTHFNGHVGRYSG